MYKEINLRGTPCPINFVRCKLEIEKLSNNQSLQVDLDRGEPEKMVIGGLKEEGHMIKILLTESNWIRFLITPNGP